MRDFIVLAVFLLGFSYIVICVTCWLEDKARKLRKVVR